MVEEHQQEPDFKGVGGTPGAADGRARLRILIAGAVQGVGFRPFVHRLAGQLALAGWVANSAQGVALEVEGNRPDVEAFLLRVEREKPPLSVIQSLETTWLDPAGHRGFTIRESQSGGARTALILPDIATCPDCLAEIFDSRNRRHRYPFTNCTNCGPRFSIIESLSYDRANTSMRSFAMCRACEAEYHDPNDRRFHAQPIACPECGPQLSFLDAEGARLCERDDALRAAAGAVKGGRVLALKALGGFQLIVAAHDDLAVLRLRESKHREEKPFALMFPSLEAIRAHCEVSALEERLLRAPEAPIVLLRRRAGSAGLSGAIAPRNPYLGAMLPCAPVQHLLLAETGFPVVATSGNLGDEPICIDNHEALRRLNRIADAFLLHDRPIVRPIDDSVARVMLGRELVLRRARGYAPLPVFVSRGNLPGRAGDGPQAAKVETILAVGGHLKNTVALAVGERVFVSQHIGNLETAGAIEAFGNAAADLQRLFDAAPALIACDTHPEYASTKFALELAAKFPERRCVPVQHHVAHVLACAAENEQEPPFLGVAWDGTGHGPDGTIWGGEFFHFTPGSIRRAAHLRPFRLPGGEAAVREPWRAALGLLHEMLGAGALAAGRESRLWDCENPAAANLLRMLERRVNSSATSSVGRLFDAVAALTGVRKTAGFEGQAAMELEFALDECPADASYAFATQPSGVSPDVVVLDWQPVIVEMLADRRCGCPVGEISAKFHNALAEAIAAVAARVGERKVLLSGGCFQNRYLAERTVAVLRRDGFEPYWHQRIPPNDGGIALGQVVAALRWQQSAAKTLPALRVPTD